jgi:hypothetical protein
MLLSSHARDLQQDCFKSPQKVERLQRLVDLKVQLCLCALWAFCLKELR